MTAQRDQATFTYRGATVSIVGRKDEYVFSEIQRRGAFYEVDLLDILTYIPLGEGLVVDVGANIGNHTVFFSRFLDRPVLAFEPIASNFELLEENVGANTKNTVQLEQVALGETEGFVTFEQRVEDNDGTFYVSGMGGTTPIKTLDSLIDDQKIALIKVDTEGTELDVLSGAFNSVSRDLPVIVVEAHSGEELRDLMDLLGSTGYEPAGILGRSDNYILASKKSPQFDTVRNTLDLAINRRRDRSERGKLDRLERTVARLSSGLSAHTQETQSAYETLDGRLDSARLAGISQELRVSRVENSRLRNELERASHEIAALRREITVWDEEYARIRRSRALDVAHQVRRVLHTLRLAEAPRSQRSVEEVRRRARQHISSDIRATRSSAPLKAISGSTPGSSTRTFDEPVRIGIASTPNRIKGLQTVVDALYEQADEICVYLNSYESVPDFLDRPRITAFLGEDVGDRGKFFFIDGYSGYYLTVDDDIHYPPFYVDYSIDALERYGRNAVVGWHGGRLLPEFSDYYDAKSRQVLSFQTERGADSSVHLLGTGCMAMHTDTMEVAYKDFPEPNMADIFFALQGQRQRTPFVVLKHSRGWAKQMADSGPGISDESIKQSESYLNTRARVNELVAGHPDWRIYGPPERPYERRTFSMTLVGRTDESRWKKGGILKSAHATRTALGSLGVNVILVDLETSSSKEREPSIESGPLSLIYPGDPDRPDFDHVIEIIRTHAEAGKVVVVNLSHNAHPDRVRAIKAFLSEWQERSPGSVYAMVFTDALVKHPDLEEVSESLIALPKTIDALDTPKARFDQTSGIFLGDYGKLCNQDLFDVDVEVWISAIREVAPGVPLFAVKQYAPQEERDLGIEVLPFLSDNFHDELSRARLMVSLCRYCTFEMVPLELASMGVPILYRGMEQSLDEYLAMSGARFETPDELGKLVAALYEDSTIWEKLSRSSQLRARSYSDTLMSATLYLRLKDLVEQSTQRSDRADH